MTALVLISRYFREILSPERGCDAPQPGSFLTKSYGLAGRLIRADAEQHRG
jgi:hypothetical protein